MKAVVYDRPGSYAIAEVPVPEPGPGEVLLKVLVAGVCGTDLHIHEGEFGPSYPLTPGHEFVGEVAVLGEGVDQVTLGDRVAVDNTASCGRCVECRRARPAFCRSLVAQGVNAPGGFAEYVVTDANRCFVVNDLEAEVAVFAEPAACVVHGLDVLNLRSGASVLLVGAGPTGLLLTQLLAASGANPLTVAAPSEHKLRLAAARGADRTVRIARGDDLQGLLRPLTDDQGFDVVIDATGSLDVLEHAIPLTRTGGTVFVYGMAGESARLPISPYDVFRRELTVKGSFAQQYSFDRSLQALRTGRIGTDGLITHRFPLDDYGAALDEYTKIISA